MKKHIPIYNKHNGELIRVYEKLTDNNKRIIEKEVIRWGSNAGKDKVKAKRKDLIKLADILDGDLKKITFDDYLNVANLINNCSLADTTKNDFRTRIKEFLRDNYSNWSKRFNNFKELKSHKENIPKKYEDLPTPKDFEKLIKKTDSILLKTLIQIMLELGARGSEVLNAKWGDWNEEEKSLKLISTKNKKVRILPLNLSQKHLERWKKEYMYDFPTQDDYIFPSIADRNKPMGLNYFNKLLRRLSKEVLGIPVTSYFLRHSTLNFLQQKLTAKVYEKIADHSIQTANRYSHLNKNDLKNAMNELVYQPEELSEDDKHEMKEMQKELEDQGKEINILKGILRDLPNQMQNKKDVKTAMEVIGG